MYSKLMCWVAVDRGTRLADILSFPADRDRWLKVRDQIYEEIMTKGWNPQRQAFVQHYNSYVFDAANLHDAARLFRVPERSALAQNARCGQSSTRGRWPGLEQLGLSL